MKFKKYHRKHPRPKWHYRAISTEIIDGEKLKEIVYYNVVNRGMKSIGVEIYSGITNDPSDKWNYSRNYTLAKVPKKYKKIVAELKKEFQKITWSKAEFVNYN